MKINISNQASIPKKNIRFLKWKIRKIHEKFSSLLYAKVSLTKEGTSVPIYQASVVLGVPGNDIVLVHRSEQLSELWRQSTNAAERYLRKYKEKELERSIS